MRDAGVDVDVDADADATRRERRAESGERRRLIAAAVDAALFAVVVAKHVHTF